MFDISQSIKKKLSDYSERQSQLAEEKCLQARDLLNLFAQKKEINLLLEAVNFYNESLKIYPRQTEPYLAIANISLLSGKYEEAQRLINQVLQFEPFNSYAQKMLSLIKEQAKKEKLTNISKNKEKLSLSEILEKKEKQPEKKQKSIFAKIASLFLPKKKRKILNEKKFQEKNEFILGIQKIQESIHTEKIIMKMSGETLSRISEIKAIKPEANIRSLLAEKTKEPKTNIQNLPYLEKLKVTVPQKTLAQLSGNKEEKIKENENKIPVFETIKVKIATNTLTRISQLKDEKAIEMIKNLQGLNNESLPKIEELKIKVSENTFKLMANNK